MGSEMCIRDRNNGAHERADAVESHSLLFVVGIGRTIYGIQMCFRLVSNIFFRSCSMQTGRSCFQHFFVAVNSLKRFFVRFSFTKILFLANIFLCLRMAVLVQFLFNVAIIVILSGSFERVVLI